MLLLSNEANFIHLNAESDSNHRAVHPVELAHSFLFCSWVCFCLNGSFNCISFYKFSQELSAFSLCSSGLISALLSFQLYISIKVSLSPDMILCGWLGLKQQLTNINLSLRCYALACVANIVATLSAFFFGVRIVSSHLDFSHGVFGSLSPGKASYDRVALPNLRCMLDVLVFP